MNKQDLISILKPTFKSFIKLHKSNKEETLTSSKIGGIPYWPKSKEYPKINKEPLKLIAQINLAELSEKINPRVVSPHLPSKGILQFFFVYNDDSYGAFKGSYVFYHEDITEEHYLDSRIKNINLNHKNMPFNDSFTIDFSIQNELLGLLDRYNRLKFEEIFEDIDLDDDEICEILYDSIEFKNSGNKMGGYAFFNQEDPIVYASEESLLPDDLILLLQLDTEKELGLNWGENGIANWRISESDLQIFNFENVSYNWDCEL